MYIWLVERTDNADYDEFSGFVIVAKTEAEARFTHPYGDKWDDAKGWGFYSSWPVEPKDAKVTKIGKAAKGIEAGVVLSSFHAG